MENKEYGYYFNTPQPKENNDRPLIKSIGIMEQIDFSKVVPATLTKERLKEILEELKRSYEKEKEYPEFKFTGVNEMKYKAT